MYQVSYRLDDELPALLFYLTAATSSDTPGVVIHGLSKLSTSH